MHRFQQVFIVKAFAVMAVVGAGEVSNNASASIRAEGGHGVHIWYEEDYENDTVEMMVLAILMCMAIAFEALWRRLRRMAERSYRFGQGAAAPSGDTARTPAAERGIDHVQLKTELVNRAAGEFMTLGFLAACTFVLKVTGILEALAHAIKPGWLALPATDEAWLHVIEIVHMKLFVAMLFYFILVFLTINGSISKMEEWENFQARVAAAARNENLDREVCMDQGFQIYLGWRCYFVVKAFHWARDCPGRYQALLEILGLESPSQDIFRQRLEERLPFGDYLSRNVEAGLCDSIQLHGVTWMAMILITVLAAALHASLHIGVSVLTLAFVMITILALAAMLLTVRARLRSIGRIACTLSHKAEMTPYAPTEAVECRSFMRRYSSRWSSSSVQSDAAPWMWGVAKGFHERHSTELVALRMLQVACVLLSFGVAHTLLAGEAWRRQPQESGFRLLLSIILYLVPAICMPSQVPEFLGLMALPPYVDDDNVKALFKAIQSRTRMGDSRDRISTKALLCKLNHRLRAVGDGLKVAGRAVDLESAASGTNICSALPNDPSSADLRVTTVEVGLLESKWRKQVKQQILAKSEHGDAAPPTKIRL